MTAEGRRGVLWIAALAGVAALVAAGCATADSDVAYTSPTTNDLMPLENLRAARGQPGQPAESGPPTPQEQIAPANVRAADRLPAHFRFVVYTVAYEITVQDVGEALRRAEEAARGVDGYVQSIDDTKIVLRVPAARLDEAQAAIEKLGRVARRQSDAVDVTEEYVDLESRLKNAENVRERLRALLAKAEDVKAALEVERELKRVNEEIEVLTGKLRLLGERVALSTITIQFQRVSPQHRFTGDVELPFDWIRNLNPERLWKSN